MARPSRDCTGMALAQVWAERSTDSKVKVGVVIQSDRSFLSISSGYNGRYPGCPTEERMSLEQHESEFIHGEIGALLLAAGRWIDGEGGVLYSTHEPCRDCALAILAARRITRVVYRHPYVPARGRRGSVILREAGLEVLEWTPPPPHGAAPTPP